MGQQNRRTAIIREKRDRAELHARLDAVEQQLADLGAKIDLLIQVLREKAGGVNTGSS